MQDTRPAVALLVTLDTKSAEAAYVRTCLEDFGVRVIVLDTGIMGEPALDADFSASFVADRGGTSLATIRARRDRALAVATMSSGAEVIVSDLYRSGHVQGVICIGGGQGSTIGAAAVHSLPIGVPKVILSTIAGVRGAAAPLIGTVDTHLVNSVVDLGGLNSVSRQILANAAASVAGMVRLASPIVEAERSAGRGRRLRVAESMFGVTTPCVTAVRERLEAHGIEVVIFAATGNGDRAMENLISAGGIDGVVDVTISQVGQSLLRGEDAEAPDRLKAAATAGIPQVVSFGGLDIIVCPAEDRFTEEAARGLRKFAKHSTVATVVRPTVAESALIGAEVAARLNDARGPVTVLIPRAGLSAYSIAGGPLHDPRADEALIDAFSSAIDPRVTVKELDLDINSPRFAAALTEEFLSLVPGDGADGPRSPNPHPVAPTHTP